MFGNVPMFKARNVGSRRRRSSGPELDPRNQICFVTPPNTKILGACVKSGTPEDEGCIGGTFCYTQSCRTSTDAQLKGLQLGVLLTP